MSPLPNKLEELLGTDVRGLALLRIGLGIVLLVDLADRLGLVPLLYSDAGVLPRQLVPFDPFPGPALWSGSALVQSSVVLTAMGAALLMILGVGTRLVTFVLWVILLSLWWRHPGFLSGGDYIALQILFWSLFLPMDARFALRGSAGPASGRVFSFASAGLCLLMPLVYFFSVFYKATGAGWVEGTAVLFAASHENWARDFGLFLVNEMRWAVSGLTYGTLLIESVGPLLLFSPWHTTTLRVLTISGFLGLQLGLGLSIELFIFPFISSLALLPLVPSPVFDRLLPDGEAASDRAPRRPLPRPLALAATAFTALVLVYVLFSNIERQLPWDPPRVLNRAGRLLGMNQGWAMYSTERRFDVRVHTVGTTTDGREVVIDDWSETASHPSVERLRAEYRGRAYLERLTFWSLRPEIVGYASFVCRTWNRGHEPPDRLARVDVVGWKRDIVLEGERPAPVLEAKGGFECGAPLPRAVRKKR
jgi:hypothetical protein